jgi:hypothetical protein
MGKGKYMNCLKAGEMTSLHFFIKLVGFYATLFIGTWRQYNKGPFPSIPILEIFSILEVTFN